MAEELRIGDMLLATQCEICNGEGWVINPNFAQEHSQWESGDRMTVAPREELLCCNCYSASGWVLSETGDILHYFVQVLGFKKRYSYDT